MFFEYQDCLDFRDLGIFFSASMSTKKKEMKMVSVITMWWEFILWKGGLFYWGNPRSCEDMSCVWVWLLQQVLTCKYDSSESGEEQSRSKQEGGAVEVDHDAADELAHHVAEHLTAHYQTWTNTSVIRLSNWQMDTFWFIFQLQKILVQEGISHANQCLITWSTIYLVVWGTSAFSETSMGYFCH